LPAQPLPIMPFLKIPESGSPYIEATKCSSCGALTLRERLACGKCGARGKGAPHRLADKGKLHAFSIIYRAFPGIDTPFISAIADLEGGGTIKTNLIGIEADPDKIELGMDVDVVYEIAPRKDAEGNEYMTYFLKPSAS
jgi:uncharacterized OB-fold protein